MAIAHGYGYSKVYLNDPLQLLSLQKYLARMERIVNLEWVVNPAKEGKAHYSPGYFVLEYMCRDYTNRFFHIGITDFQRKTPESKAGKRKKGVRHLYVMFDSPKDYILKGQQSDCDTILAWIRTWILGNELVVQLDPDVIWSQKTISSTQVTTWPIGLCRKRHNLPAEPEWYSQQVPRRPRKPLPRAVALDKPEDQKQLAMVVLRSEKVPGRGSRGAGPGWAPDRSSGEIVRAPGPGNFPTRQAEPQAGPDTDYPYMRRFRPVGVRSCQLPADHNSSNRCGIAGRSGVRVAHHGYRHQLAHHTRGRQVA